MIVTLLDMVRPLLDIVLLLYKYDLILLYIFQNLERTQITKY